MRRLFTIIGLIMYLQTIGQSLEGAWEWTETQEDGKKVRGVVTFTDRYQSAARFDAETGAFISTNGGIYFIDGNTVTEVVEFDSNNPARVGDSVVFDITWEGQDQMKIEVANIVANRVDAGAPGALAGAWLISGRMRDGEVQERSTDGPRKTMKILSGKRFQWIAYNTETKQFMGTGGGTYTTVDGIYTENIEYFSRDDSRVGASLEFTYEIKDGKWHHSGKTSKGDPMYEVWSRRLK